MKTHVTPTCQSRPRRDRVDLGPPSLGFSGLRMGAQLPARLARTLSPGGAHRFARVAAARRYSGSQQDRPPEGRSLYQLVLHCRPPAKAGVLRPKKGDFPNVGNRHVLAGLTPTLPGPDRSVRIASANLVSFPVLSQIKPQAPRLVVPFRQFL